MDIYFRILSVPTVVTGITAIIFSSVFIPALAKFKSDQSELNKFINSWVLILIGGLPFTLVGSLISISNMDLFIPENTAILND